MSSADAQMKVESASLHVNPPDNDGDSRAELSLLVVNASAVSFRSVRVRALLRDNEGRVVHALEQDEGPLLPGDTAFVVASGYAKLNGATLAEAEVLLSGTVEHRQRMTVKVR